MKNKKPSKPYTEMNLEELQQATADCDREFVIDRLRVPPPPEEVARHERARQRGRPKNGKGVTVVSMCIEKDLLRRTDRLAKKLHLSRSGLVARSLEAALGESC